MRPSFNFLLGFIVRIAHGTQRPLPYPHHFIYLQILRYCVGDEHHRHFALELVDGGGEVFGGGGIEAAVNFGHLSGMHDLIEGSMEVGHQQVIGVSKTQTVDVDLPFA